MVFFQHRYITRQVVMPYDQIIKAVGDLKWALQQRINAKGEEEMETLQKLNDILNNVESSEVAVKKVTFEIFDNETGKLLKYRQLITHPKYRNVWMHSSTNEFGRLAQGVQGRIQGTNTIFFIQKIKFLVIDGKM